MKQSRIQDEFLLYRKTTIIKDAPINMLGTLRCGFYAGAAAMYKILNGSINNPALQKKMSLELADWFENNRWKEDYSE